MLRLSRLWTRQILKLVFGVLALLGMLFLVDRYYNILPSAIQTRILLHQQGHVVVDLKVESCFLQSRCPITDQVWFRVPKELSLNKRWNRKSYLYVKRVKEEELTSNMPVILDVAVDLNINNELPPHILKDIEKEEEKEEKKQNISQLSIKDQHELAGSKGWTKEKFNIWIKRGKYNQFSSITSVDVLFGHDAQDPRLGWQLREGFIGNEQKSLPRLTVRIGPKQENPEVELRIHKTGKFKIIQLADLHFSTDYGACRDLFPANKDERKSCKADPRTLEFVEKVLDQEQPDYVVLTGDQIYGESSPDSETSILKVVAPLIRRKIPYSMVMGNHDDEGGSLSRKELVTLVSDLPYSLTQVGPENVSGYGNYVQQVLGPRSENPALTFYFLDSHSRSQNNKLYPGYAWIEQDQLDFVTQSYNHLKEKQAQYSHIHMSMAFMHIPFTEYVSNKPIVGQAREPVTASKFNLGTRDVLANVGVSVVSVGHDHVNDYCMFHDKTAEEGPLNHDTAMWLCFGGATGEGGYGGYGGYERRVRLFEIDTQAATISSWKLLHEHPDARVDEQVLVRDGKAALST
ncbi:uncharacterized protein SAPINGB_P005155 [Magnusiomyces paraingens]|uniref:Calcineurin-like phosphoesterase domain-containing protein n=1 Tax=Magnusiomyces paraingens TaxID=2606893 RepID=A0A5E8C437_9ASCO|nr:uncharacterized protein SAPINGB_P005155 [Saprochaete ingens]VVT56568.1 unnamed protein product [Saprochaete ingens]